MVAPRQFCFDTLDGRGPRSARGLPEAIFQNGSKLGSELGSKNGVQNGVQIRVQNGFQKWGPKMGSKLGSKNGGCHHYEQLPPQTKMKNHRFPFHLGQVAGRWGGAYGGKLRN